MIKTGVELKKKRGINYLYKNGKKIKFKPWIGNLFSFLYDLSMEKSVFPKKFEASLDSHTEILRKECYSLHNSSVLELGAGSGTLSEVLPHDNIYSGVDISDGLLRIALKRFKEHGFSNPEFYVCSADDLPFEDDCFDACICNLSLNFFPDVNTAVKEIHRVLNHQGELYCSVPVPERNTKQSTIRGQMNSEAELSAVFANNNFSFLPYDYSNGAIFYFKAVKN